MFFDNIFGISDDATGGSNKNDKHNLKHVSLRQGHAFLKDEKK